ncbi:hypothetical protein BH09PSE2_BH09PSE2_14240 [soil metagenome]
MADASFEHTLHRLFQDNPSLPDSPLFAARIEAKLERDWTLRRLLIGAGGAAAGVLATWQVMGSNVLTRIVGAIELPTGALSRQNDVLRVSAGALQQLPYSGEVVWLVGGLVLLAAGFLATRAADQF